MDRNTFVSCAQLHPTVLGVVHHELSVLSFSVHYAMGLIHMPQSRVLETSYQKSKCHM